MERLDGGAAVPAPYRGGIVALGNFDGFHAGHQAVVGRAVARARAGEGPSLLVFETQRYYGHNSADMQVYRTKADVAQLRIATDPIDRFEKELLAAGVIDEQGLTARLADIDAEVEKAVEFALASPLPSPRQLTEDVFAPAERA